MSMLRMAILGTGAVGAAGAAVFGGPYLDGKKIAAPPAEMANEICLKSNLAIFEGADARCYSHAEIRALIDRPVLDLQGEPVSVSMSHPADMSIAPVDCRTCRDYREMSFDGWYASTSRDMRREGYFIRACGVLGALSNAQTAGETFFADGSPTAEEVAALAATMKFGETDADADGQDVHVEHEPGHIWRISAGNLNIELHEIANADFDNDGVEEILTFSASAPEGGTAAFYDIGLLERDSADAALVFTPMAFGDGEASGVGG